MSQFDSAHALHTIRQLIRNPLPIDGALAELVEHCAKRVPSFVWGRVAKLDFAADSSRLNQWLVSVLRSDPPDQSIKALWFGLFLPMDKQGRVAIDAYVAGSKRFDPKDDTFDWTSSPEYFPAGRYANSQVLRELYELSQQDISLSSPIHEIVAMGFVALTVAEFCRRQPELILAGSNKRHIATGFDAGDGFHIGIVSSDGFKPAINREINHLKPLTPTRSKAEFYLFQKPMPWEWVVTEIENQDNASHFIRGKYQPIAEGWETQPLPDERRPPVDVLFPEIGPPIIHERIATRIGELCRDAVQFIPVTVRRVSSDIRKYVIFHVLKDINCIDLEASRYLRQSTGELWVFGPVIRRSLASGHHVFRIDGPPEEIVVSRDVKVMLEQDGVSGIKLVPIGTTA